MTKSCHCGTFIRSNQLHCDRCESKVGYNDCGCPSCFEIQIGLPGELCDECVEAGCGEERTIGQPETECLVERCECGGNIHRHECYCEEENAA